MTSRRHRWIALGAALWLCGCGADDQPALSAGGGNGGGTPNGGGNAAGGSNTGGNGGGSGDPLDALLEALRADRDAALLAQSHASGWPAPVAEGFLFVSVALPLVAGDHDAWTGTTMNAEDDFYWQVIAVDPASRYKFTDLQAWEADRWSRAYQHDANGIMSQRAPTQSHLERFFEVGDAAMAPRTVRVWVPEEPVSHLLYAQDGQNLFDPTALWGGWDIAPSTPPAMMIVGIDNTAARFDEYTHVEDDIGALVGGDGDAYADYVDTTVRTLIATHYGEPPIIGLLGSSLGGLISFHIAARHPGQYDFAASMSGTMGWGSIGLTGGAQNETMIERYQALGHGATKLYLDSGGNGTCVDSDNDGIEDDALDGSDNHCENKQLESVLYAAGYVADVDVWHWWEPGAPHNEAAWGARVFRPLQIFAGL